MAFIQALAALKYLLAWHIGNRMAGVRFGFACTVSLAIAGWSTAGLIFPTHIALVETTLLVLALVTWRCVATLKPGNALVFGLASAACLHAHPTSVTWVAAAGLFLLWRYRSLAALFALGLAATIVLLSLLPPWLERDAAVAGALKPIAGYMGNDIAVRPLERIFTAARGIVTDGAWWGLLLMTPWKAGLARAAWWMYCACLLFAMGGLVLLRGEAARLRRVCLVALLTFLAQIIFVVMVRPITPVWMVPSCLPPLALAIAIGWYGWLGSRNVASRVAGTIVLGFYVVLVMAPFSFSLRDIRAVRAMPGVNPFLHVGEQRDRFVKATVPFYPVRRIDRLSEVLCEPMVLHARLAAVIEPTFGSGIRNACGHWPQLRYGGVEGPGTHVAGLLAPAATASGIAPDSVVSRMALYRSVRPIAPDSGGRFARPQRLQINPESAPPPMARSAFDFDAKGADAVVLTNRLPMAAPMNVGKVLAGDRAARGVYDDGGSFVYRCDACAPAADVHWHIELQGIEGNLDLVVLPADVNH
jgi:hypothetical protein